MNLTGPEFESVAFPLAWTLLHFCWQGAFLALLLRCLLGLVHPQAARLRYAMCCVTLTAMAVIPAVTFFFLHGHKEAARTLVQHSVIGTAYGGPVTMPRITILRFVMAFSNERLTQILFVWALGVVVLSVRLLFGLFAVRRMKRIGIRSVPDEMARLFESVLQRVPMAIPVRLMSSALVQMPMVIGWLRPIILMPVGALSGLSELQLEAIIAHELAHIRRQDYLINILQTVLEAVLFYHPGVWWVSNAIRIEREHCCDDFAVQRVSRPVDYARALSLLEERRASIPLIPLAVHGGILTMRIERILGITRKPLFSQPVVAASLTALVLAAATLVGYAQSHEGKAAVGETLAEASLQSGALMAARPQLALATLPVVPNNTSATHQAVVKRASEPAPMQTQQMPDERRRAYADEHLGGVQTARGHAVMLYGLPSSIDSYPSGGVNGRKPYEIWNYDHTPSVADRSIRFVDECQCGNYELAAGTAR